MYEAGKLASTKELGLEFCQEIIKHFDASSPLAVPMLEAITKLFLKSVHDTTGKMKFFNNDMFDIVSA